MPPNPGKRRCAFDTRHGHPCQAYAVKDTDPPAGASHARLTEGAGAPPGNQNARTHGFRPTGVPRPRPRRARRPRVVPEQRERGRAQRDRQRPQPARNLRQPRKVPDRR